MTKHQKRFPYAFATVAASWLIIVVAVMIWQYEHLPGDTYVIWLPGLIKFGVVPAAGVIGIGWLVMLIRGKQPEIP